MENSIAVHSGFESLAGGDMTDARTRSLRNALGAFATGVTVIMTKNGDDYHGMTANAFTAVSLDPPLILVSVSSKAKTAAKISEHGEFSVNLLSLEQENVSSFFSGQTKAYESTDVSWFDRETPFLDPALGTFVCSLFKTVDAGDHTLFLGRVEAFRSHDHDPLLFYGGQYRKLAV